MPKQTCTATVNGKTYSRNTARGYTHIVLVKGYTDGEYHVDAPYWCGSLALAQKQLATAQRIFAGRDVAVSLHPVDA